MSDEDFPEILMDHAPLHWEFAVEKLGAGRALDKHIALDIMDWTFAPEPHHPRGAWRVTEPTRPTAYGDGASWVVEYDTDFMEFAQVPRYSTDMNAALDVARHSFVWGGDRFGFEHGTLYENYYRATIKNRTSDEKRWPDYYSVASADAPALAICRAAILHKRWHDTPHERFVWAFRHEHDYHIDEQDPMPPLRDGEDYLDERQRLAALIQKLIFIRDLRERTAYVSGGPYYRDKKPEGEPRWYVELWGERRTQERGYATFREALAEATRINLDLSNEFNNKEGS